MKSFQAGDIRNFAVVGHASSGKTMLCEAMLACSGVINRMGRIAAGNTVSDYHDDERQHGISIHTSLMHTEWLEKKFNLIDTPGYLDFISEGLGALRVGDFALVVIHAQQGIGVGTDQVWRYATQFDIPKMIVLNAMDREGANFDSLLEQCRVRFGNRVFPLSLPLNPGPGFNQVLDVLRNDVVTYALDGSGQFTEAPAAGANKDRVSQLHKDLIELTAEADDALLEKFFAQGSLTEDQLRAGEHAAVQKQAIIPLFCTNAEGNVGVARLMDFIAKYGSSPVDREQVAAVDLAGKTVEVALHDPEPALYVFKTMSEAQFGDLSYFRLYSGHVHGGMDLYNADRKCTERLGQIFILNGRTPSGLSPCPRPSIPRPTFMPP
jgi:elongation factor G